MRAAVEDGAPRKIRTCDLQIRSMFRVEAAEMGRDAVTKRYRASDPGFRAGSDGLQSSPRVRVARAGMQPRCYPGSAILDDPKRDTVRTVAGTRTRSSSDRLHY